MSSSYKPANYTTVSPYLIVDGASATIDFLVKVLGAVELRRFPDDAGKVVHAEVRIDDTVVMIADGGGGWPPVPSHVHIYVEDVDATYKRALEAGGTSVQEPVKKEDADKRGGVKDTGGTTWWIATKWSDQCRQKLICDSPSSRSSCPKPRSRSPTSSRACRPAARCSSRVK